MPKPDEFDMIITTALTAAAKVHCSTPDYLDGLERMKLALDETVAMVREEVERNFPKEEA